MTATTSTEMAVPAEERSWLLDMYERMHAIRTFEQECGRLGTEGVIAGSMHFCGGQEAVALGACAALGADDRVLATYRGHGWALARGLDPKLLMAEICHRADGINGGRGGSAYFNAPSIGFLGENSIVGAGLPIACGVAFATRAQGGSGLTVVSFGDGAMNQGATNEAFVYAAAQHLPVIFVLENNGWSEMTPISATALIPDLARRADAFGFPGIVVDGNDPLAVRNAVSEAAARCRAGEGPVLLECKTVRLMAHYNKDIEHYRSEPDRQADRDRDPIPRLRTALEHSGVSADELNAREHAAKTTVDAAVSFALASPQPPVGDAGRHIYAETAPTVRPGEPASTKELSYALAVNAALGEVLEQYPESVLYGEDVAVAGGVFGVTRSLQRRFGEDRVFDTPISESAILGSALGASLVGMRPIVEIMWGDFLMVALDQLVNQAANTSYISRGELSAPLVVRMQQGATPGSCAQHSQSLESFLAHIPGLRVGLPSTAQDGYAMLRAAVSSPDPVVLIESRGLYQNTGDVELGGDAETASGARWRRRGSDAGIITWGSLAPVVEQAAELLAGEGINVNVLDLRWLNPLDDAAIAALVAQSSGRIVVAHEANLTGGFGAEIVARITDRHFFELDTAVVRVGTADARIPASPILQRELIPGVDAVVAAVRSLIGEARPAASFSNPSGY